MISFQAIAGVQIFNKHERLGCRYTAFAACNDPAQCSSSCCGNNKRLSRSSRYMNFPPTSVIKGQRCFMLLTYPPLLYCIQFKENLLIPIYIYIYIKYDISYTEMISKSFYLLHYPIAHTTLCLFLLTILVNAIHSPIVIQANDDESFIQLNVKIRSLRHFNW